MQEDLDSFYYDVQNTIDQESPTLASMQEELDSFYYDVQNTIHQGSPTQCTRAHGCPRGPPKAPALPVLNLGIKLDICYTFPLLV